MVNFFELFNLEPSLDVDTKQLRLQYYALSKQFHPDNFTTEKEAKRMEAEEKSAEINKAYHTLKTPQLRIAHILELNGCLEEGKDQLPMDFLMEMMELNEEIAGMKSKGEDTSMAKIEAKVKSFEESLESRYNQVKEEAIANGLNTDSLAALKDYYLKTKYLKRIKDHMDDESVEL